MKVALAVFVKTPGMSPVKTRLAKSTSSEFASEFYERSIMATSAFVKDLQEKVNSLELFWAVAEEQGAASAYWLDHKKVYQGEGDLGTRLNKVYGELINEYDAVFFMGADSPHLSSTYIAEMILQFLLNPEYEFLLGNTSDGGYYFFGGKRPILNPVWLNVRYSSTNTSLDFSANLREHGKIFYLNENFDIDEKNDLEKYSAAKFSTAELLDEQKKLIEWIKLSI